MFYIDHLKEEDHSKFFLRDKNSGTYAVIIPEQGAILNKFTVVHEGGYLNVIDGYHSQKEFDSQTEELGFKGCKLSPFVCRLENGEYHFGEKDYRVQKSLPARHALHGLIYDKAFRVVDRHESDTKASISLKYEYRAEDPGYPFDYDCLVTWTLEADNRLSVETTCVNRDKGLIPMQDGWHPYFTFEKQIDELQLEFQASELVEFNDELLPTGKLSEYTKFSALETIGGQEFDHCFKLNFDTCQPLCVFRDRDRNVQLEIYPATSYPYLQIYTPPHRRSIAIENISGAPNAFNNGMGMATIEPGQTVTFATTYKITRLANENE